MPTVSSKTVKSTLEKTIELHVKTGSKEQSVSKCESLDNVIDVHLTSEPVKEKANKELIEVLSKFFGVPKDYITILRGAHAKKKLVKVKLYTNY